MQLSVLRNWTERTLLLNLGRPHPHPIVGDFSLKVPLTQSVRPKQGFRGRHLAQQHLILQCLGLSPSAAPNSSFLLTCTLEGSS